MVCIGAVILARMGSSRLPGKALLELHHKPVIQYMAEKVRAMAVPVTPVVTMTDRPYDDVLEDWCRKQGVEYFRGSENDVLGRVEACARHFKFDAIIRLNADNPLLPVPLLNEAITRLLDGGYDYVSNVLVRDYPFGVSAEAMTYGFLKRCVDSLSEERYREHVTLYVREHPEEFKTYNIPAPAGLEGKGRQLALDTHEDIERTERILDQLGTDHASASYEQLLKAAPLTKVILVQGPQSAEYLAHRYGSASLAHWVAYDVRAEEYLKDAKIPFIDMDALADGDELESIDRSAHELSRSWYREAGAESLQPGRELFIESVLEKECNYLFLGLFRALHLLECIRLRFSGGVEIVTTLRERSDLSEMRMSAEESFIPAILGQIKEKWGWRVSIEPLDPEPQAVAGSTAGGIDKLLNMVAIFKQAEIVYSGNPSLLAPVVAEQGVRALRLRWIDRRHEFLGIFKRDMLPFRASKGSEPSDAEQRLRTLEAKGTFCRNGVSLLPVLKGRLRFFYSDLVSGLRRDFIGLRKVLRATHAKHVIVDEDVTDRNGLLVLAAKAENIPTTVVLHGTPIKPLGFVPLKADRIAVWGSRDRDVLSSWGVDKNAIRITGCPKYDRLTAEKTRFSKEAFCRAEGLDASRPIVLVAPANLPRNGLERFESLASNPFEYARYLENFLKIASQVPGVQFVMKFHAGAFDKALFDRFAARSAGVPKNLRVVPGGVAIPYLLAADLVFCGYSSLVFEAMYLDRPVALTNFSKYPHPFFKAGSKTLLVTDISSALKLCRELEAGTFDSSAFLLEQENFTESYFHAKDGGASKRAADFAFSA